MIAAVKPPNNYGRKAFIKKINKLKTLLLLVLAITSLPHAAASQNIDSLKKVYRDNTIYRSGMKFEKGNTTLTYHDLAREFTTPETQHLYIKSKHLQTTATIFNVLSAGLAVFSTVSSGKQSSTISAAVSSAVLGLVSIILHTRSAKFLDKAIWINNGETLFNRNQ